MSEKDPHPGPASVASYNAQPTWQGLYSNHPLAPGGSWKRKVSMNHVAMFEKLSSVLVADDVKGEREK